VSPVKYELDFYIPEDDILYSDRREILKSYKMKTCFIQSHTQTAVAHFDLLNSLKIPALETLSKHLLDLKYFGVLQPYKRQIYKWGPQKPAIVPCMIDKHLSHRLQQCARSSVSGTYYQRIEAVVSKIERPESNAENLVPVNIERMNPR
jgi:hypothetical protein